MAARSGPRDESRARGLSCKTAGHRARSVPVVPLSSSSPEPVSVTLSVAPVAVIWDGSGHIAALWRHSAPIRFLAAEEAGGENPEEEVK